MVELLRRSKSPVILALNKVDRIHKPRLLPLMQHYGQALPFKAIVPISALSGDGQADLEKEIVAALPEGPPLYEEDYLTDQSERRLAAELVREKVLAHTRDELPYTTAVIIDSDDLSINKCVGFKVTARLGDKRKLLRKCIPPTGPQRYLVGAFPDEAAIAV